MESLFNYGSDEENDPVSTEAKMKPDSGEQDVNYDNITMDMSEDSTSTTDYHHLTSRSGSIESNLSTHEVLPKKNEDVTQRGNRERKRKSRSRSNEGRRSKDRSDRRRRPSRDDHHRDRERDRGREREERHRYRRSRSPSYRHDRCRRSRSPRDRSKYSRREHSPPRRHRERSPRRGSFDRRPSKLSILEKLGIELKIPEAVEKDGPGLPSYYNPIAMNPAKYAEQVAKRKLLWSSTSKQGKCGSEGDNINADSKGTLWEGATFSQDQDGKMTAKFQRLMGIKQQSQGESSRRAGDSNDGTDLIKKQEELFSSMELQYEVARAATHTQRGVGLGFGVHHYPR